MSVDTIVKDDLTEFSPLKESINKAKNQKEIDEREARFSFDYADAEDSTENPSWILKNTNILVPEIKQ